MTLFSAGLIALSLLGALDEAPANSCGGGGIAPETRVEPAKPEDVPGSHGLLMLGLRLHGPRFQIQGEGTRERPLIIDLPVGDLFKIRIVSPNVRCPLDDGNIYY
jgi:hypothetical protein